MAEAQAAPGIQAKRSSCVRSSALAVLVLLLFTSGIFAVAQAGYGSAACRVLVSEAHVRVLRLLHRLLQNMQVKMPETWV